MKKVFLSTVSFMLLLLPFSCKKSSDSSSTTTTTTTATTTSNIITTIAGTPTVGYTGDGGMADTCKLHSPYNLAIDAAGNIYIADNGNSVIRKINTAGIITTIAGNGTVGYTGDGGMASSAKLAYPRGLAIDALGNIYIADQHNNVVRKINSAGIISTVAGSGTAGYSGDGNAATLAKLNYPTGVALDTAGNLYIADYYNNVIRKVNALGTITTIAGNGFSSGLGSGGFTGDGGPATAAELYFPSGVAVDITGNIYIADTYNNVIRKVNNAGTISTIAGIRTQGYSGNGGAATSAQLYQPNNIRLDANGNIYVADEDNNAIRMINTSGTITTIAGNGLHAYLGDGGVASVAYLNFPSDMAFDAMGNMYIADRNNNVIRKVTP